VRTVLNKKFDYQRYYVMKEWRHWKYKRKTTYS